MNIDKETNIVVNSITNQNKYVPINMKIVIIIYDSFIDITIPVDKPFIIEK